MLHKWRVKEGKREDHDLVRLTEWSERKEERDVEWLTAVKVAMANKKRII